MTSLYNFYKAVKSMLQSRKMKQQTQQLPTQARAVKIQSVWCELSLREENEA
jgi:hypothetical protein